MNNMKVDFEVLSLVVKSLKVDGHKVNFVKVFKDDESSDNYDEYMIEGDGLYPFIKFDFCSPIYL